MGKGGGSGGGSGSGIIKHSAYLEYSQALLLYGDIGTVGHTPTSTDIPFNIADDIDAIRQDSGYNNPYHTATAYDPTTSLNSIITAIGTTLMGLVNTAYGLADYGFDTAIANAKTQIDAVINDATYIAAAVAGHSAIIEVEADTIVAKYQVGMRNINAVVSSAYAIGEAIIRDTKQKQVDKYAADLALQSVQQRNSAIMQSVQLILQTKLHLLDLYRAVYSMLAEAYRVSIVANKEYKDETLRIDVADELWNLELYQYMGNLMANIGGGVSGVPGDQSRRTSQLSSALGGAMTGAAMGGMAGMAMGATAAGGATVMGIAGVTMPWFLGIGAALGLIGGLLS